MRAKRKSLNSKLSDFINLGRLEIISETEDFYTVQYQYETYEIAKSNKTYFSMNETEKHVPALSLTLENRLVPDTGIFQDKDVPQFYKEIMMFHEIREIQYKDAEFDDAHERAVNDEIIYVLKHFNETKIRSYLNFLKKYREKVTSDFKDILNKAKRLKDRFLVECESVDNEKYEFHMGQAIEGDRQVVIYKDNQLVEVFEEKDLNIFHDELKRLLYEYRIEPVKCKVINKKQKSK